MTDVDLSSVMLSTAYDAAGASHNMGVLRCELLDWIVTAHPRISVIGVATIIDPAFGHGRGAYFRSVMSRVSGCCFASVVWEALRMSRT